MTSLGGTEAGPVVFEICGGDDRFEEEPRGSTMATEEIEDEEAWLGST